MDSMFDFSYFPVLETERLRLRKLSDADADQILALYSDPEATRYLIIEPPCNTREDAIRMIDWMQSWFDNQAAARWGITLREGGDSVIGTIGFHYLERTHRRCDLGYDLLPIYWNRGYVTEAARAVVGWCFENLNLHRVQADCTAGNIGSERVLEKVGFTLEGIWRENTFEHGQFVSLKQYGLLRREYLPGE